MFSLLDLNNKRQNLYYPDLGNTSIVNYKKVIEIDYHS